MEINSEEVNDNKNLYNKNSNDINIKKEKIISNINYSEFFNKIKNSFSKNKNNDNKKVNQTFCCVNINLHEEFD